MMNKKGTVVLRDIMFMMLIVSSIFVFAGFFIGEMAVNYENINMSEEWAVAGINTSGNSMFYETGEEITDTGDDLSQESTGIYSLISSAVNALQGLGNGLMMVLFAPNTIGSLISSVLADIGIPSTLVTIIKISIVFVLWVIVIFSVYSAFLRGGKI